MIDTDKIKAALAATPLCQANWTQKDGDKPTMLCAVSAMVSFAGVQPDLIDAMAKAMGGDRWFRSFAAPVLLAEYGIPLRVAENIPPAFDMEPNEWRGVTKVLAMCEAHNMEEMHADAIHEDAVRFPQRTCAEALHGRLTFDGVSFTITGYEFDTGWAVEQSAGSAPLVATKVALSKPKQHNAAWLGKKHKHAHKALGY